MSLKSQKILKIKVTTSSKEKILEYIKKYLVNRSQLTEKQKKNQQKPLVITTPNPEQIVYANKNLWFADILNRADIAIPDGIGIVAALRFFNIKYQISNMKYEIKRIPGVELMKDLVKLAAEQGFPVALIGGRAGLAVETFECLRQKYPRLQGWAEDGPEINIKYQISNIKYTNQKSKSLKQYNNLTIEQFTDKQTGLYFQNLAKKIVDSGVRLVFVGLGAPKQELFIEAISHQLSAFRQSDSRKLKAESLVLMAVGGSFDILTGRIKRAPLIFRNLGLEWLWRLVREPWRWKRQLALVKFFWLVLREKLTFPNF